MSAPAIEQLLDENRALIGRLPERDRATHLAELRRAYGRRQRAHVARMGAGRAPERGDEIHRAARAYNAALPKITQYYAELGQNLALFDSSRRLTQQRRISHTEARRARRS